MHEWFQTPPGQYALEWERRQFSETVVDLFGYHAIQLGLPDIDTLTDNRMPHRWLALDTDAPASARPEDLRVDFSALPFQSGSLDLVVLPHTLELHRDPHQTLREVERVLMPEGRVVISGLNPLSLWGLRQWRAQAYRRLGLGQLYLPDAGEFIGYRRLRDWLRLLGFEVESGRFGCYRPAVRTERWLTRWGWMDRLGSRWWPIFGAVYFIVAVKRMHGMRLIGHHWLPARPIAASPMPVAQRDTGPVARGDAT